MDLQPIRILGARQNNLKNIDVTLQPGTLTVVSGVSGAGKSSLVFDTLYAEGQRRYVETFSAYARQFLERIERPDVERIEGVPPAIAIEQSNTVRNSRSTVGTMTELNDYLRLLFARAASLYDLDTGALVVQDHSDSIVAAINQRLQAAWSQQSVPAAQSAAWRVTISFAVALPAQSSSADVQAWLAAAGYSRVLNEGQAREHRIEVEGQTHTYQLIDVEVDRLRYRPQAEGGHGVWHSAEQQARLREAVETALLRGEGVVRVDVASAQDSYQWSWSSALHCPESGRSYVSPEPHWFSFNSAVAACPCCKGFGRVIAVDWDLVIPDGRLSLSDGAIKVFQTPAWRECQDDLLRHAALHHIPTERAWHDLTQSERAWVLHGESAYRDGQWSKKWYGVQRFFDYLESKVYKMHIRVLLSRYRSYSICPDCAGARLQTEPLLWRIGSKADADAVLAAAQRFRPAGVTMSRQTLEALPGLNWHDVMQLPLSQLLRLCQALQARHAQEGSVGPQQGVPQVLGDIVRRLHYLCDVGLDYLSLDRQSRTLSGGEVQRINLTTALGSGLVHTLFVLDEPTVGLHARDVSRLMQAMQGLKDAGNTLVVVEHDPSIVLAADRILDMGPGPGEQGGQIVFDGNPQQLLQAATTTAQCLTQQRPWPRLAAQSVRANAPELVLQGARAHNLRVDEVRIPLHRLVVVTGVSGSGKSTLVQDILAPALQRHFALKGQTPAEHSALLGMEHLSGVVFVDQAPIGKSARSTPASYTAVMEVLRARFAATPLAQERGYRSSHFSFNSGQGRCAQCGGAGHEHIEMQFLSDVYLCCPVCKGSRYRPAILEVRLSAAQRSLNIAEVLQLTVAQAQALFGADREMQRALQPLCDVGLEYVRLGQSVPTLSGGEAQRLKLAAWLGEATHAARRPAGTPTQMAASHSRASAKSRAQSRAPNHTTSQAGAHGQMNGQLLILDEPTTGLHHADVAQLMHCFARLLEHGHSVLVVEHHLDVIAHADWLIDLGPEGGAAGGQVVVAGPPERVEACAHSHTGAALRNYRVQQAQWRHQRLADAPQRVAEPQRAWHGWMQAQHDAIRVVHARENNLKNISLSIRHGQLNVMSGVSGSGKSTLAFDIVFGEGQRRYLDSLGAYARALVQTQSRPDVEAVYGLAPTVALEQRSSRGGRRSTVGTITEIWHYLRLLFVRLGVQHCVHDGSVVEPRSAQHMEQHILQTFARQHIGILAPLVRGRKGHYAELAAWAAPRGYSHLRVDGEFVRTEPFAQLDRYREHRIELPIADVRLCANPSAQQRQKLAQALGKALELGKGVVEIMPLAASASALAGAQPVGRNLAQAAGPCSVFSTQRACPECQTSYEALDPRLFSYNSKHGWCPDCVGTGLQLNKQQRKALDDSVPTPSDAGREQRFADVAIESLEGLSDQPCGSCAGTRLNATARAVRLAGRSIVELAALTIPHLQAWLDSLSWDSRQQAIASAIVPEIRARLAFLVDVGLGYLRLDRAAPTLSGGEAQRIRLAAQLGSHLQGVCYVLDEPTIGLHVSDNQRLLKTLRALRDKGNTLLVVEHDPATLRAADHIIDIGPGAGVGGGRVVAQGDVAAIMANPESITGQYLRRPAPSWPSASAAAPADKQLCVRGARLHNLQQVDCTVPLQRLVVFTGVSGSGKSSLARGVLLANMHSAVASGQEPPKTWQHCRALTGWQSIARVLEVDQTPIGKTPRSCPATYVGFWDDIRKLFAQTLEAKERGYSSSRFSFNTAAGRCAVCEGQGYRTVSMNFLPDAQVLCEGCKGARFDRATLQVRWRGQHLGDVLRMDVSSAYSFFASVSAIAEPLQLLQDVGLGYLTLGQPSPTLSGGEAQRIKLVAELLRAQVSMRHAKRRGAARMPHTLYVLDEPTTGLHMADVARLIAVLQRFVAAGHSVIAIEHDLDFIAAADYIIDMGPEGGDGGGRIVASGSVAQVMADTGATGAALRAYLADR